jgi:hypothetical protein
MTEKEETSMLKDDKQSSDVPPKEGYIRVFTDHTRRWYEDIPEEEYNQPPSQWKTELLQLLQKEIDAEMLRRMKEISQEFSEIFDAEFIEKIRAISPEDIQKINM